MGALNRQIASCRHQAGWTGHEGAMMSNETYVTVRGYVGSVPTIFGSDPQRSTVVMCGCDSPPIQSRGAGIY